MRALLLAAGEGRRLRPLTLDRPKPMLPLGDRPILEYLVDLLRQHHITEIAINLHYMPASIVDHFADGSRFGVSITYSHEPQLLGSAGAAQKLDWFFSEPFVVLYGDVLTNVDLGALIERHERAMPAATLAVYEVDDPTRCGIVELDRADRIVRFVEKPSVASALGNLANAGVYVVDPSLLALVPPDRPSDFGADVFPLALTAGLPLQGVALPGYILDIGSVERYAQARFDLQVGRFRPADAGHLVVQ